ncbi:MAG: hypothetical protein KBC44_00210 [Candidatus Pacebacteria bacterium]|nr:hypothetical protein [Candidatus Paceibacterota bacterium]MBP9839390.1 hypothetical protein [Candidatus Paceibacterota bacterium]MDQ5922829.1 hypothetical protein [Patescibacteria group bacterium]
MNGKYKEGKEDHPLHHKFKVHHVLAQSYSVAFFMFLIGVLLDLIFPIKIFHDSYMTPIGLSVLFFASIIIFWAQRTSRDLRKIDEITKESFCRGPYCYSRTPTHWGLFLLLLGFGIVANASFVILTTIISSLISKIVFLKREERILVDKYGAPYLEYQKSVKF